MYSPISTLKQREQNKYSNWPNFTRHEIKGNCHLIQSTEEERKETREDVAVSWEGTYSSRSSTAGLLEDLSTNRKDNC